MEDEGKKSTSFESIRRVHEVNNHKGNDQLDLVIAGQDGCVQKTMEIKMVMEIEGTICRNGIQATFTLIVLSTNLIECMKRHCICTV